MRRGPETSELMSGWVEHRTARAMLFHSDFMEAGNPYWVPLSQITEIEELEGDINRYEIHVKSWLYEKNEFR